MKEFLEQIIRHLSFLKKNQLQNLPPDFQLTQGMLASADILAGERNLITYFTFPITRAFEDAFREPD